jgi:hypothetical protein
MAKKQIKQPPIKTTTKDKEVMDGLNMPFEEVMKRLANPPKEPKSDIKEITKHT